MAKKTKPLSDRLADAFDKYDGAMGCGCCAHGGPPQSDVIEEILEEVRALERSLNLDDPRAEVEEDVNRFMEDHKEARLRGDFE